MGSSRSDVDDFDRLAPFPISPQAQHTVGFQHTLPGKLELEGLIVHAVPVQSLQLLVVVVHDRADCTQEVGLTLWADTSGKDNLVTCCW